MDHCVYCGMVFPAELKQGVPEPEALKWVDRPGVPPDAAKQLEMMKFVPSEGTTRPRSAVKTVTLLSIPLFALIFLLLYSLVRRVVDRILPGASLFVLFAGVLLVGYLLWSALRAPRE